MDGWTRRHTQTPTDRARNARPPAHRTSPAPTAAPSCGTSDHEHDARAVPRCDASDRPRFHSLPIVNTHQSACVCDPQLLAPHTRQNFHSSQLPLAHLSPPQSDLLPEVYFRGTFLSRRKGDIIIEAQQKKSWRNLGEELSFAGCIRRKRLITTSRSDSYRTFSQPLDCRT